mmetsp:Transcript_15826/g.60267  ORF Transcript_15826/g.60267 Transcript_15826/m.60267 type:complete len:101 (-) Transcript_15826:185-487(-)
MLRTLLLLSLLASCLAFQRALAPSRVLKVSRLPTKTFAFGPPDDERPVLTRENEAEEYFQSESDRKSDSDKLGLALAGLAVISLPFLLGMALYIKAGMEG